MQLKEQAWPVLAGGFSHHFSFRLGQRCIAQLAPASTVGPSGHLRPSDPAACQCRVATQVGLAPRISRSSLDPGCREEAKKLFTSVLHAALVLLRFALWIGVGLIWVG